MTRCWMLLACGLSMATPFDLAWGQGVPSEALKDQGVGPQPARSAQPLARQGRAPPWWEAFGDPQLSALVERAMAGNADLDVAAARVGQARAEYRLARATMSPQVDGAANGGRARALVLGKGVDAWSAQPQLSVSYDLDLFKRLANTTASSLAQLTATQADQEALTLAVQSTAVAGYINLLGLDARLEVTRETLSSRAQSLRIAERRAEAGYGDQLELSRARAEYQAAAQLEPVLELAVTHQERGLSLLVGQGPQTAWPRGRLGGLTLPVIPANLPAQILHQRPDVFAAEQRLVAADRSLDAARAALLPDLNLNGSAALAFSTALSAPVGLFSVGAGVLEPIVGRQRLKAKRDGASARRDEAAARYRKVVLTALGESEDALVAVGQLRRQVQDVEAQRDALILAQRLAARRFAAGYTSHLEVLDAQRGLLTARLSLTQLTTDQLLAQVTLYRALGGGWRSDSVTASPGAWPR